ncbi:putative 5-amino-6-(5-phosphoribosylamino)uracil reductase [Weissella koreensis KACC 15510]|uniref:dihydrofolate reductase family protein n=1 Tax=Weissella koreensis TaxID=165096 RepID=UPI0002175884|nr:dihydrofolate reductase family protein [Weissella koreensis]AEJ22933.1 putative 5-amino-6-(5-phosphoribosylamino)uracil reductase [Weissella koreensis KACC 15510]
MDRSKVIIHMYVSIDGKIDGPHGSAVSSAYYSDELFRMSNADANGRETIQMYAASGHPDLGQYDPEGIEYEDWLPEIKSETWSISFDRKGQCGWEQNYFEYNGHKMHAVEIVTKQASKNYLAFLRSMNIPYIISGEEDFNFEEVLVKLKQHFTIDTLAVCGGAVIDGAFLKAHVVDEISLVVAPHVDGNAIQKAAFDTLGTQVNDKFSFVSAKPLSDGGVHLLFKKDVE